MITIDNKEYRNLQEQVLKNAQDILYILQEEGTLNQFGLKVVGEVNELTDLPTVEDYKMDHDDWQYGDAYMVGENAPYLMVILTRANGTHPNDYWLNIGQFPLAGPQGEQGEQGAKGEQGERGAQGEQGPQGIAGNNGNSVFYINKDIPYSELASVNINELYNPRSLPVFVGNLVISQNGLLWAVEQIHFSSVVIKIYSNLVGPEGPQGPQGPKGDPGEGIDLINDSITAADHTWSSNKIQDKLDEKLTTGDVATVALTGSYNDLDNKPTIPVIPTTVSSFENDADYVDSTNLSQVLEDYAMTSQIPTKTSDLTNDSDFINSLYHDTTKQDKLTAGTNITITNNVISAAKSSIAYQIVESLPQTGDDGTIYLVAMEGQGDDIYKEYIWVSNLAKFELLGTTQIDLSDYATKQYMANYVAQELVPVNNRIGDAEGQISNLVTFAQGVPNTYATKEEIPDISNVVTKDTNQNITGLKNFESLRLNNSNVEGIWRIIEFQTPKTHTGYTIQVPSREGTLALIEDIPSGFFETWTFELENETVITKSVFIG